MVRNTQICIILVIIFTIPLTGFSQETVENLEITVDNGEIILTWDETPGATGYRILKSTVQGVNIIYVVDNFYNEPLFKSRAFFEVYSYFGGLNFTDEVVLEDFESGTVILYSYPEEDREPNSWSVQSDSTYLGSQYALTVYGNTWKVQDVTPQSVQYNTYWGIAVNTYNSTVGWATPGEIMAFGVGDEENELFYTFRGSEMADSTNWRNTFFCWGDQRMWLFFQLPIGRDWSNAFAYEPTITRFIYVNDEDAASSNGGIYFDYICDITEDMPLPPTLSVDFEVQAADTLTVQFYAEAEDPDSDTLYYHWDFGDGEFSEEQNPLHAYPDNSTYSVQATVFDETGLEDHQSITLMNPVGSVNAEFVMNFTGDCMLGRRYWQEPWSIIPNQGWEVIWEPTLDILGGGADLTYVNLECVFTDDTSEPHPTKQYIFYGQPEYINALAFAGVDGVTLANNHTSDYMEPGFSQTVFHLDTTGIGHFGAGMNEYEAMQPLINFHDGVSVASLGYCNRTGRADNLPPFMEAGPDKFGFTWFTPYALEQTIPQTSQLYDLTIVQVHCGIEYDTTPDTTMGGDSMDLYDGEEPQFPYPLDDDSTTLDMQKMAIDLGADLVVAHHPHVLQGFEVYNNKLIAHSMGNFVFDQNYFETFISMILYTKASREGILKVWFRPVYIDDYIPGEATGELGRNIMHRIADYSRDLETVVMPDYENNVAYIALNDEQISSYEVTENVTAVFIQDPVQVDTAKTYPVDIELDGFVYYIESASGVPDLEIQFGREELWMGNFEEEGSTIWELNSTYETLDHSITYEGDVALKQMSNAQQTEYVSTSLQENMKIQKTKPHTATGWIKTINANSARVEIHYVQSRFGGTVSFETAGGPINGVADWSYFCLDLDIPDNGNYINVYCETDPPYDDESYSWFDEVKVIRWDEAWQELPLEIPYPNNYNFIRIRGGESMEQELVINKIKYNPIGF